MCSPDHPIRATLFHVKHEMLQRVADWCGFSLVGRQKTLLELYENWLADEALDTGGLGQNELSRLGDRHIADSLLFSRPLSNDPRSIYDLGSGVGLPGIPLAIVFPDTPVSLIDRSQTRVDLARRVVRVLDLDNVEVVQGDIGQHVGEADVVVSRATLRPEQAHGILKRLLRPGGVAVWGGSWISRPVVEGWTTIEVPPEILDHRVWLLMMRTQ